MTDILSAINAIREQSRYRLDVWNCPDFLDVLSFRARENLSQPYRYFVHFTCANRDLPAERLLGQQATFTLQAPTFAPAALALPVRAVHGVIRHFKWVSGSADEARYRVELVPRLALLSLQQRSAIYQRQSVPEIVEQVLRQHHFEGPDFEFRLTREYPVRELVTQWHESDLAFIQRLLAEIGIYYRFELDPRLQREVLVFSDSQLHYQFDVHVPLRNPAGLTGNEPDSVWGLQTRQQVVAQSVQSHDYNYRDARNPLLCNANAASRDSTTYGEVRHYAEPFRAEGDADSYELEPEGGTFYARLRHERLLNEQRRVSGRSSIPTLVPGQVLEINGETPASLDDGLLITRVQTSGARNRGFRLSLYSMPYSETVCFRPPLPPRPTVMGTLSARVASRTPNDRYAWLDDQGRYRVKVHFDQDHWAPDEAYLWARLAKPSAGDTYGWHAPLLDGTEVALAFDGGDVDRPYIAYALHDSQHPDLVTDRNYSRNVLRTPANNKLRLEDKRGEEHAKLGSEHGKSQLNLGQVVDSSRKSRGQGVELRTDGHGVLRAGAGLFVSADEQPKAHGETLDHSAALAEIELLQKQIRGLSAAAQQANALSADLNAQVAMFEQRLKPLNQCLLMSAPEGMVITSGGHLQLAAAENLVVNVGGNVDLGVMKRLTVLVGGQLGVFARKFGMKLIAQRGKVEMEAQNAELALLAKQLISLTAVDGDIDIIAKKKITLNAAGSYLTLSDCGIEYGTQHQYFRHTIHTGKQKKANQPTDLPVLAEPINPSKTALLNYRYHDDEPLVSAPFVAVLADGSQREGRTDGQGGVRLENLPEGAVQLAIDADSKSWLRKDPQSNAPSLGTTTVEGHLDVLIQQHRGAV